MSALLMILKVILVIWIIIVIMNFFRFFYLAFTSDVNQIDDEVYSLKKAKNLLFLGTVTVWITAIWIYYAERLILERSTEYSAIITYITGVFLILIVIFSVIWAVAIAWCKRKSQRNYVSVFRSVVRIGFVFSIILWLTTLVMF